MSQSMYKHKEIEFIYYIINLVVVIKFLYIFYINMKYKHYYLQSTIMFDKMINKELYIIYSYYKTNKSIKLSRNFSSLTKYDKHKKNKKVYNYKCKVTSKYIKIHKKILVAIHSHVSLFYQRYVIRKTYKIYNNIQLLFFIGLDFNETINQILNEEMILYKDIILFNFYSDYKNLHYLTYNFILWAKENKDLFDIIIKQDIDVFLNLHLLQNIITNNLKNETYYVLGYIWNYKNKKKEYAIGMSYIFSSKSLDKLTNNIERKYSKFKYGIAEDKFVGYLAREANFTFYDSYNNFYYKSFLQIPDNIDDINNILMIHDLRISEIAFLNYITTNSTNFKFFK